MDSKKHIHILDSLKGLAMIFVILTHFTFTAEERLRYLFPFHITMAVPIFMIISGYVYAASYEHRGMKSFADCYDAVNITKRILRFTVPYLLIIIAEFILDKSMSLKNGFIGNLAIIAAGGAKNSYGAYYYPIMIQFIFVFPVIFFMIKNNPKRGIVMLFVINCIMEFLQMAYGMNYDCYTLLLFRYIFAIAFGAFLFFNKEPIKPIVYVLTFAAGTAFLVCHRYFGYKPRIFTQWSSTSCLATLYLVPIMTFAVKKLGNVKIPPLEWVGKVSFDVFLIQMIFYKYFSGKLLSYIDNRAIQCLTCIAVCIAGGSLLYLIEHKLTDAICKAVDRIALRYKAA